MIHHQALRPIEVLLVEDSSSDANLTIKGFLNAQIPNNLHWVEDGESAINRIKLCLTNSKSGDYLTN
ncbi:hypothetical protein A4S05_27880 [Nostoc sp. KVJ20]|uniref:hypothetical protein n=1 Tax=unclassified Nostoc TaxID=2593658 RepID=UPI00083D5540|nr:hypothetical protein [Nostoc sp. KVJ20]ODH01672.1 hypothetical protein A4S05_27880 [Nostoc sp. KVJ20]